MEEFTGTPEFDMANTMMYQPGIGKMPHLRFHTTIRKDEMLPLPEKHTLNYQEIHWELENWTLFQQLP